MLSGARQPVFGALRDQAALEMRNGAEDMKHELPGSGCCVDPLFQADQIELSCLEVIDRFEEFFERAPQTIEADNREGIVGTGLIEQGSQTWSFEGLPGDHVLKHAHGAVLYQPIFLARQILISG